ncbi:uncharacterized protein LOC118826989 [Colossoma macropomum]|uniref:uncharacterized protein LOC118826989 n=1 Tax=Colossoma macropomum TaxID=42526 RepID=UPI001864BF2A|nr:uncharacterized protein LOC118826989 [Colossoma macropomum]
MQSCSSALCILILLISTFTTESRNPTVKVKLHDSATLPCHERCSGLVRWTVFYKPTDALAECDQTSCWSEEGYQMIHDQYLKGDLSLIIADADFSQRDWYTCWCDDADLCDVRLQVEPVNILVQIKPGEPLVLKMEISDPVDLIYKDPNGPSSGQICAVDGRSLQCKPEYTQRASLTSVVRLRRMTPSDSGVYTVIDKWTDEVIHIYTVTVGSADGSELNDDYPDLDTDKGAAVLMWLVALIMAVLVAVIVMLAMMIVQLRRETQQLLMKTGRRK